MSHSPPDTTALLIVDVQQGFINESTKHIPALVESLQSNYRFVAASQFINSENSPHRRYMDWNRFSVGSDDSCFAFKPSDGCFIFEKNTYSCMTVNLYRWLRRNHIDSIDICGIDTDVCVLITAAEFFDKTIRPVVMSNFCASHGGSAQHEAAILVLRRIIGSVNINNDEI